MVERRLAVSSIVAAGFARTNDVDQCAIACGDHDSVVTAVGDEQAVLCRVYQHLAGKSQGRVRDSIRFTVEVNGSFVEQALFAIVGNPFLEQLIERIEIDFAGVAGHHVTLRIDDPQAGPARDVESIPQLVVAIVNHRMLDIVAEHRIGNIFRVLFGVELGRMNADDDQLVRERMLKFLQNRQDVHAVDAAIGPEIEQHKLATQLLEIDRSAGVDPSSAGVERRRLLAAIGKRIACGRRRNVIVGK